MDAVWWFAGLPCGFRAFIDGASWLVWWCGLGRRFWVPCFGVVVVVWISVFLRLVIFVWIVFAGYLSW